MRKLNMWAAFLVSTALAASAPAVAEVNACAGFDTSVAPDYRNVTIPGAVVGSFDSPEADARPGLEYFAQGVRALKDEHDANALHDLRLAAYWGYDPAKYFLGLLYFNGLDAPENRALGTAWMVLAAESRNPKCVKMQNELATLLSGPQFAESDKLFSQLQPKYSFKVTSRRAKARWRRVGDEETGSHLGHTVGDLRVGGLAAGGDFVAFGRDGGGGHISTTGSGLLGGGSIPGSVAYRQFQESGNPYSPKFMQCLKGRVVVKPLRQVKAGHGSRGS